MSVAGGIVSAMRLRNWPVMLGICLSDVFVIRAQTAHGGHVWHATYAMGGASSCKVVSCERASVVRVSPSRRLLSPEERPFLQQQQQQKHQYLNCSTKGTEQRKAHPTPSTSILSAPRDLAPEEELFGTGVWLGDPTGVVAGESVPALRARRGRRLGKRINLKLLAHTPQLHVPCVARVLVFRHRRGSVISVACRAVGVHVPPTSHPPPRCCRPPLTTVSASGVQ